MGVVKSARRAQSRHAMKEPESTETTQSPEALYAASEVAAEMVRWLTHIGAERRLSGKTVEAYQRDAQQFLAFLSEHLGQKVSLASLAALEPRDVRAFMAA